MATLLLGFVIKIVTGFDDTITRVPIIAGSTRNLPGRLAFILGMVLATILSIIIASLFAEFLHDLPYERYLVATLLFLFALGIWFDLFVHHPKKQLRNRLGQRTLPFDHFTRLVGIGFVASAVTTLDDIVAYAPILIEPTARVLAITGILLATGLEVIVILTATHWLAKLKFRDELAAISLALLGLLVLLGVV